MKQHLFVYGTLKKGGANAQLLESIGGTWLLASVKGQLYPNGIKGTEGYPALVLDNNKPPVQGYVFSSMNLSRHWKHIDHYEGVGYQRITTTVKLKIGQEVEAFIYTPKN